MGHLFSAMVSKVLKINEYEKDESGELAQCIISAVKELKSMDDEGGEDAEESASSISSSSESDDEENKKTKKEPMVEISICFLGLHTYIYIYNFCSIYIFSQLMAQVSHNLHLPF